MKRGTSLQRLRDEYAAFLHQERRARAYLGGQFVDDVGVAISVWAHTLMLTNLASSQRARASFMLPTLACFLLGAVISGPLADWAARLPQPLLERWRWKVILVGRASETLLLGVLVLQLFGAAPSLARILPYVMVSAFMKTALRATRIAFCVDLLEHTTLARAENGATSPDERGQPLEYKTHLVTFSSLASALSTAAVLAGLLIGGRVMAGVGEQIWLLFAADVLTNLGFLWVVWRWCRPCSPGAQLLRPPARGGRARHVLRTFLDSHVQGLRFLAAPARRPLLALLGGAWIVEVVSEAYNGKLITKHILHGSDDAVRYAEIAWTLVALVGALLLPLLVQRIASLGRIFLISMGIDAAVIGLAGLVAATGDVAAIAPFVALLCLDHSLTLMSTTLTDVAQNSVSSPAQRGRIAGSYAVLVILGDLGSEALAVLAEQRWGIPGLVLRAGMLQLLLVALIAGLGGRRLWNFGLRGGATPAEAQAAAAPGAGRAA